MARKVAGYELAATRLLNRGRKMSGSDEERAQAELLIAAANTFALLELASAIRGQQAGVDTRVAVDEEPADEEDTDDVDSDEEPADEEDTDDVDSDEEPADEPSEKDG